MAEFLIKEIIPVHYCESVNKMLISRKGSRLIKTQDARRASADYLYSLNSNCTKYNLAAAKNIGLDITFFLAHSLDRRDLDNMIKLFQDQLATFYNFNDNKIVDLYAHKRSTEGLELDGEAVGFKLRYE